jgi:hypothetical protein
MDKIEPEKPDERVYLRNRSAAPGLLPVKKIFTGPRLSITRDLHKKGAGCSPHIFFTVFIGHTLHYPKNK